MREVEYRSVVESHGGAYRGDYRGSNLYVLYDLYDLCFLSVALLAQLPSGDDLPAFAISTDPYRQYNLEIEAA